jgi:hypothetical protein
MMDDEETRQTISGAHKTSFPMFVGNSFSEVADHSFTSNAEVKNLWSYTSIILHGVMLIFLHTVTGYLRNTYQNNLVLSGYEHIQIEINSVICVNEF